MNQSSNLFESTFFVLDFDRCIGNTDKIHEVLWSVIENETGISANALREAKRDMDAQGYTFDTVEYVAKELLNQRESKLTWQEIRQLCIAKSKTQDLLEPYTDELLRCLDNKGIPYGILTYGKETWQLTKLEAAGLVERGVPFEITGIEHKCQVLTSWRHEEEFIIPSALTQDFKPLHVRSIVFLDDKPRSFVGIPDEVCGICVRPVASPLRPSQQGEVPEEVKEVKGIRGAIEFLGLWD